MENTTLKTDAKGVDNSGKELEPTYNKLSGKHYKKPNQLVI